MEAPAHIHQAPQETAGPSRPLQTIKVIGGPEGTRHELVPADATGRLEREIYVIQQAAQANGYEPGSYMDERFQMAAAARQNTLVALESHGGNVKATRKALKAERRQAVKNGDTQMADNTDQELSILRRVGSTFYDPINSHSRAVRKLETSRDPQFGERGMLRSMGRSVLRSVSGDMLYGYSPEPGMSQMIRDTIRPKRAARGWADQRSRKLASLQERSVPPRHVKEPSKIARLIQS
jgi:hypothetical protein